VANLKLVVLGRDSTVALSGPMPHPAAWRSFIDAEPACLAADDRGMLRVADGGTCTGHLVTVRTHARPSGPTRRCPVQPSGGPARNPARAIRSSLVKAGWIVASAADGAAVVIGHLSGPALTVAAVAAVGTWVRPVFRYPHMWRYLESRRETASAHPGTPRPCKNTSRHRRARQRARKGYSLFTRRPIT
jgi:hypothetical protein